MTTYRGSIEFNGKVILKNITFHLIQDEENLLGFTNWTGFFLVPSDQEGFADYVSRRSPFYLVLDDGRRGEFNPREHSNFTPHIYQMNFQGIGKLQ